MYYSHKPSIVTAFIIVAVTELSGNAEPGYGARLTLDDGSEFDADGTLTARYWPKEGDMLVFAPQPDGGPDYPYLQPRAVFDSKYEPAKPGEQVTSDGAVHDPSDPGVSGSAGQQAETKPEEVSV